MMKNNQYRNVVLLARVSTERQSLSSLGLDAQVQKMRDFCEYHNLNEVGLVRETASGALKIQDRPSLLEVMEMARKENAIILVAMISRLSRDVEIIANLINNGIEFMSVETGVNASSFEIHLRSIFSYEERRKISERTKMALAQLKAKGVRLGGPKLDEARLESAKVNKRNADDYAKKIMPLINGLLAGGTTGYQALANELNSLGINTRRGGKWYGKTVSNLMERASRC